MITQKELKERLHYDPNTGIFTWLRTNRPGHVGKKAGTLNPDGYVRIWIDGKIYLAHRLVWLYVHGCLPEVFIDHVNQIKNDNRVANLRLATRSQNKSNGRTYKNNKLKVKGVTIKRKTPTSKIRYSSNIRINGQLKYLGVFDTIEEASDAYNKAAISLRRVCLSISKT